ncbi:MAG: hypothetical protein ACREYF_23355 [Gammaproteobacteria bacterium]
MRAIIYILQGVEPDHHDQILPALRDLESGMSNVMDALKQGINGRASSSLQH